MARCKEKPQGPRVSKVGGRDVAPCKWVDNDVGEAVYMALKLCKGAETASIHDVWPGVKGYCLHAKWKRGTGREAW